jgi:hypothetical protein
VSICLLFCSADTTVLYSTVRICIQTVSCGFQFALQFEQFSRCYSMYVILCSWEYSTVEYSTLLYKDGVLWLSVCIIFCNIKLAVTLCMPFCQLTLQYRKFQFVALYRMCVEAFSLHYILNYLTSCYCMSVILFSWQYRTVQESTVRCCIKTVCCGLHFALQFVLFNYVLHYDCHFV